MQIAEHSVICSLFGLSKINVVCFLLLNASDDTRHQKQKKIKFSGLLRCFNASALNVPMTYATLCVFPLIRTFVLRNCFCLVILHVNFTGIQSIVVCSNKAGREDGITTSRKAAPVTSSLIHTSDLNVLICRQLFWLSMKLTVQRKDFSPRASPQIVHPQPASP